MGEKWPPFGRGVLCSYSSQSYLTSQSRERRRRRRKKSTIGPPFNLGVRKKIDDVCFTQRNKFAAHALLTVTRVYFKEKNLDSNSKIKMYSVSTYFEFSCAKLDFHVPKIKDSGSFQKTIMWLNFEI